MKFKIFIKSNQERPRSCWNKFIRRFNLSEGFTMVELLVAFTLFAVVISMVTSIFVTSYRSERNISELILVNDNTYLALEQMARDVRDGQVFDFVSPGGVLCGGHCFGFTNRNGQGVIYSYDSLNDTITRRVAPPPAPGDSFIYGPAKNLTASNVDVSSFTVTPSDCLSGNPVKVTLNLTVRPLNAPNVQDFVNNIQTTIATRNFAQCAS